MNVFPKYYTHPAGFSDGTAYIRIDGKCSAVSVSKAGFEESLNEILTFTLTPGYESIFEEFIDSGMWKEITESEAKSLLTP